MRKDMAEPAITAFDASRATGVAPYAAPHVSDIGPVTREGERIVAADDGENDGGIEFEMRREHVARIAREALRGRTATVYEGRVIDPLFDRPRRSVASLAQQFGVPEKRIYNIEREARERIMKLIERKVANPAPVIGCYVTRPAPALAPPTPEGISALWSLCEQDRASWLAFAKTINAYWNGTHPAKQCPWGTFFQIWINRTPDSRMAQFWAGNYRPCQAAQN